MKMRKMYNGHSDCMRIVEENGFLYKFSHGNFIQN